MSQLYDITTESEREVTTGCTCNTATVPNSKTVKPALTPTEKRRASYAALVRSLQTPKYQSIATPQKPKAPPAGGVFASI